VRQKNTGVGVVSAQKNKRIVFDDSAESSVLAQLEPPKASKDVEEETNEEEEDSDDDQVEEVQGLVAKSESSKLRLLETTTSSFSKRRRRLKKKREELEEETFDEEDFEAFDDPGFDAVEDDESDSGLKPTIQPTHIRYDEHDSAYEKQGDGLNIKCLQDSASLTTFTVSDTAKLYLRSSVREDPHATYKRTERRRKIKKTNNISKEKDRRAPVWRMKKARSN